jgi:uncharacterized protein YbjQ (UPF0145 family)
VKAELGANADVRLGAVSQFVATLDADTQTAVRAALSTSNPVIGQTLTAIEKLIAKTRQPALPKPGTDVAPMGANELAEITAMQAKVGADGKRLYITDSKYRADVEARRLRYFKSLETGTQV